jgi:hypothetical protein
VLNAVTFVLQALSHDCKCAEAWSNIETVYKKAGQDADAAHAANSSVEAAQFKVVHCRNQAVTFDVTSLLMPPPAKVVVPPIAVCPAANRGDAVLLEHSNALSSSASTAMRHGSGPSDSSSSCSTVEGFSSTGSNASDLVESIDQYMDDPLLTLAAAAMSMAPERQRHRGNMQIMSTSKPIASNFHSRNVMMQ